MLSLANEATAVVVVGASAVADATPPTVLSRRLVNHHAVHVLDARSVEPLVKR